MNCLCINIRGMGVDGKDGWVKNPRKQNDVGFLVMQETKVQGLDRNTIDRFWGKESYDFDVVEPTGLSGGLVSVWDKGCFEKETVIKNRNFLMIVGRLKEGYLKVNMVNVYGPKTRVQKQLVWQSLKGFMEAIEGLWIIMGDFNTVRSADERKNTIFTKATAKDFNEFIDEMGLVEYPLLGRKFTFLAGKGKADKQSKMDRTLVCGGVLNKWPNASLRALPRGFSDHCPLILHMVSRNFGPKPFRWSNSWTTKEGCVDLVQGILGNEGGAGSTQLALFGKLKTLSIELRKWWSDLAKKEEEEYASCCSEIDTIEKLLEVRSLSEEESWILEECRTRIDVLNEAKSKDLKQRARVKWAALGDDNTGFFHRVINGRRSSNAIPGIDVNGEWTTKPSIVKREVLRHFRSHFSESCSDRPKIICDTLKTVPIQLGDELVQPFSKEEIKCAVFDCGKDKAPGPDGFNFQFVQEFWDVLVEDFFKVCSEFYDTGFISPECSISFITLVPKCKNPTNMKEYRPINLIGIINKVISKLLALRIKKVMGEMISESQSAFLKDRYILDGPLVLNEVLAWLKRKSKKAFLLKIDFEKAYDNVNWVFFNIYARTNAFSSSVVHVGFGDPQVDALGGFGKRVAYV
ncbi:putative RNA-directed DNA polymerase [Helianthus annuus]|nr:putative RNA-directed DNA polymerase [Helianthus annuus]